ncbi:MULTISPECIES: CPBP family intramembrane glutamic endopeptidase [unclassified Vibrio]|uniref:CPBP family intramembrane glutamic endopeptidase n=1 Tax=unclassified Vibrio TaxID=2614977 RepID=UPI001F0F501A|nr:MULTISPECIES: CPBP family intramembrane glutamic endopeptidase [unclassified Vibrio]
MLGFISLNSLSNYIQYVVFDWFYPGSWQAQAYNFTPLFSAYDGVIDWSSVLRSAMDGVFISPVLEELIFRYLLFVIFRSFLGVTGAALLSSLILASIHQWELYAFMSGVFLCWAFERYRRLEVVIAIHAGHNLFILLYDLVYYSITQLHFNPWEMVDINIIALQSVIWCCFCSLLIISEESSGRSYASKRTVSFTYLLKCSHTVFKRTLVVSPIFQTVFVKRLLRLQCHCNFSSERSSRSRWPK